jgi:hypothetical protein
MVGTGEDCARRGSWHAASAKGSRSDTGSDYSNTMLREARICALFPAFQRRSSGATYSPTPYCISRCWIGSALNVYPRALSILRRVCTRFGVARQGGGFSCTLLGSRSIRCWPRVLRARHTSRLPYGSACRYSCGVFSVDAVPSIAGVRSTSVVHRYIRPSSYRTAVENLVTHDGMQYGPRPASWLVCMSTFSRHCRICTSGRYRVFITAASWLDVNYGRLVRDLCSCTLARRCSGNRATASPLPTRLRLGDSPVLRSVATAEDVRDCEIPSLGELRCTHANFPSGANARIIRKMVTLFTLNALE